MPDYHTAPQTQTQEQAKNEALAHLYSACVRALFDMGKAGANADKSHPLRSAWEQCQQAEAMAVQSGLLATDFRNNSLADTFEESAAAAHSRDA
jgi:hypothetical protein